MRPHLILRTRPLHRSLMSHAATSALPAPHPVARVLLVEDDKKLARLLGDYFAANGLTLVAVHDGAEGLMRARSEPWDLVILDVMLPGLDGLSILKKLREGSNLPILMLTARGGETERIAGLDEGADDYLPKTVSARELLARARALLRRAAAGATATPPPSPELSAGAIKLDIAARRAFNDTAELHLTAVEFDLLAVLLRYQGRVCSREQLLEQVCDRNFDSDDRSIDVHIGKLRSKLGDDPKAPRHIRTVRGIGYALMNAEPE